MQENNRRLIDEAISAEPVKNTFRLGWEFVTLNKKFTLSAIVVLLVLSLLGTMPYVGFIFSVFFTAFALAIQIYAGRLLYETENIETFVDEVYKLDGQKLIERYFSPALGAYMGWMTIAFLFVGAISLFLGGTNITSNEELLALLTAIAIPILIISLLLAYVQPLVQSNIVMANDFKEGLLAVFTIFSKHVWSLAFKGSYFKYVSIYGLIIFLIAFLFSFVFSVFAIIPILNIFVLIVFVYILSIIMTMSSVIARRIVE
jgi:hypothetical protein